MAKAKAPVSKSAFVRSLHRSLPAKKVVDRAKKQGIDLNEKYVYVVRSNDRRKAESRKRSRRVRQPADTGESRTEADFRRLAIELGLQKAERLLSDTKKKVAAIIAGG